MKNKVSKLKEDWEAKKEDQINAISLNINSLQDRLGRLTDAYIDRMIERDLFEAHDLLRGDEYRLLHFTARLESA